MTETVLIVDDEEPVRRTFQEWLAGGGLNCRVLAAADAEEALVLANQHPIDLAVPFLPTPASWRVGTARASMRMEQFSQEPYPWPAGDCEGV